jgi:hypothetical protein
VGKFPLSSRPAVTNSERSCERNENGGENGLLSEVTTWFVQRWLNVAEAATGDLAEALDLDRLPKPRRRTSDFNFSTALVTMHA